MTSRVTFRASLVVALLLSGCALFGSSEEFEMTDAGSTDATNPLDSARPTDAAAEDVGIDMTSADSSTDMASELDATDAAADAEVDASEKDAGPVVLVPFGQQPEGHTILAETDFADVPDAPGFVSTAGYWDLQPGYPEDDLESATDADAFISGPDVVRVTMPAGLRVNNRMWWFEAWRDDLPMAPEVYLSLALKLEGTDWENDASGVMLAFFSYALVTNPRTERRIHLELAPRQGRSSEFEVLARTAEWPGGQTLTRIEQNLDATPRVTVGEWHQIEMVARLNSVGSADGALDVWVDGYHVISQSTIEYRIAEAPGDFFYFLFFNEWNGPGSARDSEDTFLLDHARLSGRL